MAEHSGALSLPAPPRRQAADACPGSRGGCGVVPRPALTQSCRRQPHVRPCPQFLSAPSGHPPVTGPGVPLSPEKPVLRPWPAGVLPGRSASSCSPTAAQAPTSWGPSVPVPSGFQNSAAATFRLPFTSLPWPSPHPAPSQSYCTSPVRSQNSVPMGHDAQGTRGQIPPLRAVSCVSLGDAHVQECRHNEFLACPQPRLVQAPTLSPPD